MTAARQLDPLDDAAQVRATVGKLRELLARELAPGKVTKLVEELQNLEPVNRHRAPSPEIIALARKHVRERRGR